MNHASDVTLSEEPFHGENLTTSVNTGTELTTIKLSGPTSQKMLRNFQNSFLSSFWSNHSHAKICIESEH